MWKARISIRGLATVLGLLATALLVVAYGGGGSATAKANGAKKSTLPQGSEPVKLDPSEFTTRIDNPYWPMKPGTRWVYQEVHTDDMTVEKVVVKVTNKTKKMANGVTARLVNDVVTQDGVPTEVTQDYYAQDDHGNIWYLSEATTEYVNGQPHTTAGSFEAGVDGAQAGIIMPAKPKPGLTYREEYYKGHAEDKASIVSLTEQAEPPFGHFSNVLMTRNINPLEPSMLEFKFYAPGVGPVTTVGVSGGSKLEELVSYKAG